MLRRLLVLNGLAVLGVILFHSGGWGFVAMFSWPHRYLPVDGVSYQQLGSPAYYGLRVMEQLASVAIPAFLFVSGLFAAIATGRNQESLPWSTVFARVRTLAIPYLLWSGILIVGYGLEGRRFSPVEILTMLATGRTNPAYYYVPLLIQFYLLSPFLTRFARRHWRPLVVIAAVIQLSVQLLYYPALLNITIPGLAPVVDVVPKWFFPARIFWFTLGIVAGFHIKAFEQLLRRVKKPAVIGTLLLFPLAMAEWEVMQRFSGEPWLPHRETILDSIYHLLAIFGFLALAAVKIPRSSQLEMLATKSYGIYLIHSPVMEVTARVVYHVVPVLLGIQLLFQPLLIVVGLGVPLLIMAVLSRTPGRLIYKYSFG